jgi:hypothetical protein
MLVIRRPIEVIINVTVICQNQLFLCDVLITRQVYDSFIDFFAHANISFGF